MKRIALSFCILLLAITNASAQDDQMKESLRELQGVYIIIERVRPNVERDGLSESQIRADVESQLRKAGVRALLRNEVSKVPGLPLLYVGVNAVYTDSNSYSYSISVELHQLVSLYRRPSTEIYAVTWFDRSTGSVGATRVQVLRERLSQQVGRFITDFLSVNRSSPTR